MPSADQDSAGAAPGAPPGAGPGAMTRDMPPRELAARLSGPRPPVLLDVREPWEYRIARIAGSRLVPLGSLPAALSTLDPEAEYVLLCHHGVRSLTGVHLLRERGLTRVAHLAGGIDAWSTEVDPSVPRY